jgi:hypothetical protein
MKLLETLRRIPPRTAEQVAMAHAMLWVSSVYGGLPYVVLQTLLAAELILMTIATMPLYPERRVLTHLFDLIKLSALLAFLLLFIFISYAVVSTGESREPLGIVVQQFASLSWRNVGWALAYIVVSLALSMWQALHSAKPRVTWAATNLSAGGSTFVAMLFMVFVGFFVAHPLAAALAFLGIAVNPDALLASLMVLLRLFTALVMSTVSSSEIESMANNPYVDNR